MSNHNEVPAVVRPDMAPTTPQGFRLPNLKTVRYPNPRFDTRGLVNVQKDVEGEPYPLKLQAWATAWSGAVRSLQDQTQFYNSQGRDCGLPKGSDFIPEAAMKGIDKMLGPHGRHPWIYVAYHIPLLSSMLEKLYARHEDKIPVMWACNPKAQLDFFTLVQQPLPGYRATFSESPASVYSVQLQRAVAKRYYSKLDDIQGMLKKEQAQLRVAYHDDLADLKAKYHDNQAYLKGRQDYFKAEQARLSTQVMESKLQSNVQTVGRVPLDADHAVESVHATGVSIPFGSFIGWSAGHDIMHDPSYYPLFHVSSNETPEHPPLPTDPLPPPQARRVVGTLPTDPSPTDTPSTDAPSLPGPAAALPSPPTHAWCHLDAASSALSRVTVQGLSIF